MCLSVPFVRLCVTGAPFFRNLERARYRLTMCICARWAMALIASSHANCECSRTGLKFFATRGRSS